MSGRIQDGIKQTASVIGWKKKTWGEKNPCIQYQHTVSYRIPRWIEILLYTGLFLPHVALLH